MKRKAVTLANFFRQPYPYYFNQHSLGKLALGVFLLGFFFVYFFEPFNVDPEEQKMSYLWISFLHVAVSCLIFYACFTGFNMLKSQEDRWTVGKEVLSLALIFFLMGLANFFMRDLFYDNPYNWSVNYLLEEVRNTFLIGILLVMIIVPLNFARMYHRNARKAEAFHPASEESNRSSANQVLIETQVKADDFSLELESFLFAKAEGNYVEFHLQSSGQNIKLLKRITIKDLETQLKEFPWILKTHRSYLVNLRNVTEVSGNAQGYQLSLREHPAIVPVSRGLLKAFDQAFTGAAL